MAITPDKIIEVAEALVERGEAPTLAAIRRELGGGSFTTISETIKVWREQRQAAQIRTETIQVPTRVQEALVQAGVLIWTEATRQHAAQLAAEREALDAERQRLDAERREAVELADQVSRDLDRARGERDETQRELAQERQTHEQTRADAREQRALAEERGRRGDLQDGELRDLRQQAAEAAAQIGSFRAQLEAMRGQLDDLRGTNARLGNEREELRTELQQSREQAQTQQRRFEEREAAMETLRGQVAAAKLDHAELAATLGQVRQDLAHADGRATTAEQSARHVAATLEAEREARAAAEQSANALRIEVAALTERTRVTDDLRAMIAAFPGQVQLAAPASGEAAEPKRPAQQKADSPRPAKPAKKPGGPAPG